MRELNHSAFVPPPARSRERLAAAVRTAAMLAVPLLLGSVVMGSSACKKKKAKSKADALVVDAVPVRVEVLTQRPYQRTARAVATVAPWRQVSIRAEAMGRVLAIRKEVGDRVKKGQLLVRLDGSVAWQSYKATRVGIKQAKVAIRLARINLKRIKRLRASGDVPQAQLDHAQNAYDRAKAAMDMARAQSAQVGTRLSNFWVRAPFAGVLAKRPINVGDYVSPGAPVFTVVEMKRVKVVVGLDPAEGLLLKKGHPAKLVVKTVQGPLARKAQIHLIRPLADATTRRVEIELSSDNRDQLLKPGVIARVEIPLAAPEKRLLVPADAVVELLGRRYVYVVRAGKSERLEVKLGVSTADRIEILPLGANPVKVGDALIIEGVQRLVPGSPVTVVPGVGAVSMTRRPPTAPRARPVPKAPRPRPTSSMSPRGR